MRAQGTHPGTNSTASTAKAITAVPAQIASAVPIRPANSTTAAKNEAASAAIPQPGPKTATTTPKID
jgi:hypothetical protein